METWLIALVRWLIVPPEHLGPAEVLVLLLGLATGFPMGVRVFMSWKKRR